MGVRQGRQAAPGLAQVGHTVTLDELKAELARAPSRSLCVHHAPSGDFPGWLCSVKLGLPCTIRVELHPAGTQERAARFMGAYSSLEDAVRALESFLGLQRENWRLVDADAPSALHSTTAPSEGEALLRNAIISRNMRLPPGAHFTLGGAYWKRFEW